MKNLSKIKSKLLVLSVMTLTLLSACKKDDDNNDNTTPGNVVNFTTTVLSDGTIQVEGSTNQNYTFQNTKKLVNNFSGNVILIICIFSLFINLLVYNMNYRSSKDFALSQMKATNQSNIFIIDEFLSSKKEEMVQFAKRPDVIEAIKQKNSVWLNDKLANFYSNGNNFYENTFITSVGDNPIILYSGLPQGASIGFEMNKETRANSNMEKSLKGEFYISSAFPSPITKEAVILLTAPIWDQDKVIGVLGFPIMVFKFTKQFLNKVSIGKTGYSFLLDKDAKIINHPDSKVLLADFKTLPFGEKILQYGFWKGEHGA